jgi:hypothetical protein
MKRMATVFLLFFLAVPFTLLATQEGTRTITGDGIDMYFMNDKVFGSIANHPLWAIYNCGSDIKGEIDIDGKYHKFSFSYQREGGPIIKGSFGSLEMALEGIEKQADKVSYHVLVGEKQCEFSIKYEKIVEKHMVNSIIQGELPTGKKIKLTVDGHLCPFATTGIILIVAGSVAVS